MLNSCYTIAYKRKRKTIENIRCFPETLDYSQDMTLQSPPAIIKVPSNVMADAMINRYFIAGFLNCSEEQISDWDIDWEKGHLSVTFIRKSEYWGDSLNESLNLDFQLFGEDIEGDVWEFPNSDRVLEWFSLEKEGPMGAWNAGVAAHKESMEWVCWMISNKKDGLLKDM
jgi:hypothetical protein